ncbi:tag-131 [Symbiodinium sp. CCMP2592]|nr:tag-131 [Symbiodinium sp. CCMP2592]
MWLGLRAAAVVAAAAVLAIFVVHLIYPEEGLPPQSEVQDDPNTSSQKPRKGKGAAGDSYPRLEAEVHAPGARVWTPADLALHDGENRSRPLLLAILGEVYDVGPGARFYAPGEGYSGMAGKDASRAMSTGNFKKDATPSLHGFSKEQVADVMQWRSFYRKHEQYRFVGFLQGVYYSEEGSATPTLQNLEEAQSLVEKATKAMTAARERFKACNSKTKQEDPQMELWCDPGYHGDGTQPVYLTAYIAESKKEESWCACVSPSTREKAAKTADAGMTFKFTDYPECQGKSRCHRPKTAGPPIAQPGK